MTGRSAFWHWLLVLTCLGLGASTVSAWRQPPPRPSATPANTAPVLATSTTAVLTPRSLPPLDQLDEVTERPLFENGRRPPDPETAPTVTAAPPTSPLAATIIGIFSHGGARKVMLRDGQTGKVDSFGIGQTHSGWTIEDIGDDQITLRQGVQVQSLELKLQPPARPTVKRRQPPPNRPVTQRPKPSAPAPGGAQSVDPPRK